ncbi:MAG: hypothetical protein AB1715_04040 [Acidobacteriota bacterium]
MKGIPYHAIGIGIALILGIWAFIEAETVLGRIFILGTMLTIFFLPVIWQRPIAGLISKIGWYVFGASCFIFLRWRGVGVR